MSRIADCTCFAPLAPDKDFGVPTGAAGVLCDSGAGWSSCRAQKVPWRSPLRREDDLFLFPKIAIALSDSFLCLCEKQHSVISSIIYKHKVTPFTGKSSK